MPDPTPEQIGREAGEAIANAIADNLETVIMRLADSIATINAELKRQGDELIAQSKRLEALTRSVDTIPPEAAPFVPWRHRLEP